MPSLSDYRLHAQRHASHRVGERHPVERRADEPHPPLLARGGARRSQAVHEGGAIGQRKPEREFACALSLATECGAHSVGQCVDQEQHPLAIAQHVLHPLHRSAGKRTHRSGEQLSGIVAAGQLPQPHPLGAQPYLDMFGVQRGQGAAALYANPLK